MIVGVLFIEIHTMYSTLVGGDPRRSTRRPGHRRPLCRQYADTAALTLDSPPGAVRSNSLPTTTDPAALPLPLGDLSVPPYQKATY